MASPLIDLIDFDSNVENSNFNQVRTIAILSRISFAETSLTNPIQRNEF